MDDRRAERIERRRHVRISPKGTLIVRTQGHEQRARISNVSEGGVFAVTNVGAPARLLARGVEMMLRLDGRNAEWQRATGHVLRLEAGGVAIAFDLLSATLLRTIDELTTASHADDRVISVVLIDADPARRAAMAAGFRATGCAVIEAERPLEAIVRLGEMAFEPDVIAVADTLASKDAEDMRAFIERDHPASRLITIGDETHQPDGNGHWLSSADPAADLPARVREALIRPRRRA